MCECSKQIYQKLVEAAQAKYADATNHDVSLDGYGLTINDKGIEGYKAYMPVTVTYDISTRSGIKTRKYKTHLLFSHCPWCGKPIVAAENNAENGAKP